MIIEGEGKYQLPSNGPHRWLVILRGSVQHETIEAPIGYLARERACVLYQCERMHVAVGLMPRDLILCRRKSK